MRNLLVVIIAITLAQSAHAEDCASLLQTAAVPMKPALIAPIANELGWASTQLGAPTGVLAQAYDEAESVDQVLLRLRIESCRNVASALPPPSPVNANDPAAYKPQTPFDNTPWRFNMTQNGKRMTADEFDAWMKAKGIRVVRKPGAAPAETPPPKD